MKQTWNSLLCLALTGLITSPLAALAVPPAAPANIRAILLPAEVLLTWDPSPGADSYKVYCGGPNRRWIWHSTREPRFRDTEFTELPSYYQLSACNAAGECLSTAEFLVYPATNDLKPLVVAARPLSDTSFAVAWTVGRTTGLGFGEGMLEVGTSLDAMTLVGASQAPAWRHEFAVGNLAPNTTYHYRLTSWSTNGGGFTTTDRFTTWPYTPPPPVMVRLTEASPMLATDEDLPVDFTLTVDIPGGGPLEFFISDVPAGMVLGAAPNFTYLPNPGKVGTYEYFDCGFTDGVTTHHKRVAVTVRAIRRPAIALDQSVTFTEDRFGKFFVASQSFWNPAFFNYVVVSGPTNGVLRMNQPWLARGEYQYEPATNFFGIDHITFAAYDNNATGNVATVRLYVSPVNDAPIAPPQSVILPNGVTTRIVLTAKDPDIWYASQLTHSLMTPPSHGQVYFLYDGNVDFTPAASFVGADSFSYVATDPTGLSATGTVSITVFQPNRAPTANNSSLMAEYGLSLNITLTGSDPDGDALAFSVLTQPAGGTLSGTPPNLVFTPAPGFSGVTSFLFKASDGALDSPVATTLITVGSATAPPNPPSGLTATAVSRSQINLSWTDHSGRETGFKIERSNDNKKWSQVSVVGANVTSFANLKLTDRKTYYYRVCAYNGTVNSAYSNVASATTPR